MKISASSRKAATGSLPINNQDTPPTTIVPTPIAIRVHPDVPLALPGLVSRLNFYPVFRVNFSPHSDWSHSYVQGLRAV